MTEVCTRFAPSPTGMLHIGGVRTALYSWLWARKNKGKFVLRIEDSDLERSTDESIKVIIDGMNWLKLTYDVGPIFQTDRFARYKEVANMMLEKGLAYRCYCTKEELEAKRAKQLANKEKPMYDRTCRDKNIKDDSRPYVIRFKNPLEGTVAFNDLIHGMISFNNSELDDLIIMRADGSPTYNFAVVVDDWDMGITCVVRGDDHINNTPKQINILKALGAPIPSYAHVPMILGPDGTKLSKRHGSPDVLQYREQGYLPEAVLNYLVRLGWSHGDQEIFSLEEMTEFFDIHDVCKAASAMNPSKLLWLNQHYMATLPINEIAHAFLPHLAKHGIVIEDDNDLLISVISILRERCQTLEEMAQKSLIFFQNSDSFDEKVFKKHLSRDNVHILEKLKEEFEDLGTWIAPKIHEIIIKIATEENLKLGKVAQPLRVAVTGSDVSPPIDVTVELLGKERTVDGLSKAIGLVYNTET